MDGDAIYRTGSNLAFLLAFEPLKTQLNIVCHAVQLSLEFALEALLQEQLPQTAPASALSCAGGRPVCL